MKMTVLGIGGHVLVLLEEAIWKYCNGHAQTDVSGINGHVPRLLKEAIWKFSNGRRKTAALSTTAHHRSAVLSITGLRYTADLRQRSNLGVQYDKEKLTQ